MNSNSKYSLVIDARMINVSGIGTVCQNIIPDLLKDFNVTLMGNPEELKEFSWAKNLGIISLTSQIYSLQEQMELFFKVPAYDYFLSPHYNVPFLPVKAKKRIVIIHDVNHIALENNFNILKKIYARLFIKLALTKSDKIFTVSRFSKSEIIKYFEVIDASIHPLVLGVNTEIFKVFSSKEQDQIRTRYELPRHFLLYVGNVKPHKNLSTLIKAFAILKATRSLVPYKLVIVGKKEGFITSDQAISKEINALNLLNDIIFTGFVPNEDLPGLYNLASLFVFPSLYEGFGLPPLEAMACGCPTVVSDASSLPEVCQNASLYFNPKNPEELAAVITKVLQDKTLQDQLRTSGFNLVKQYDWKLTAQAIKEVILAK